MARINEDDVATDYITPIRLQSEPPKPEKEGPGAVEIWAEAFRSQNVIGAGADWMRNRYEGPTQQDFNYNPYAPEEIKGYENHWDLFKNVRNRDEMNHIKSRIDSENNSRRVLDEAGTHGVIASVAAGVVDPTFLFSLLIPGVGTGRALGVAGKVALTEGAVAAGQEVAMQQFQVTRTMEESAFNVGISALSAGILGGVAAGLTKAETDKVIANTARDIEVFTGRKAPEEFGAGGSIGAAEALPSTQATELVSAGGLEKNIPLVTGAAQQGANASLDESRNFFARLVNDNFLRKGNVDGTLATETSVGLEVVAADAGRATVRLDLDEGFKDFTRKLQGGYPMDEVSMAELRQAAARVGRPIEKISDINRDTFNYLVADALRNGGRSPLGAVSSAANKIRSEVLDQWYQRAVRVGLLDGEKQLLGADSYLMRVYDVQKIVENKQAFKQAIAPHIRENFIRNGVTELPVGGGRTIDDLDEMTDMVVEEALSRILGESRGVHLSTASFLKQTKFGPAAERVLDVPDNAIAGFLENDVNKIIDRYTRSMAPQVALMEKYGTLDFKTAWTDIRGSYEYAIQKAGETTKEGRRLKAEMERLEKEGAYVWQKLLGNSFVPITEEGWDKASRITRKFMAPIMLGGQMISSIPDYGRLIMTHGLKRPMKVLASKLNPEIRKLSKTEATKMGAGLDLVLHGRFELIADIADEVYVAGKGEKVLDWVNDRFSYVTGMKWHNSMLKQTTATLAGDRIIENSLKGFSKISKNERTYMLQMGIDERMAQRIAEQFNKHGVTESKLRLGNTTAWDDPEAVIAFRRAGLKDAETTINTPSIGTLPKYLDNPFARIMFQFKSFLFASHQQTLINGFQRRDANSVLGALTMVGFGYIVDQARSVASGQTPPEGTQAVMGAVDRSGILSVGFELANIADVGYGKLYGESFMNTSRFRERNFGDIFMGPAVGTVGRAWDRLGDFAEDGVTEENIRKTTRLLPGQNLYGTRPYELMIDALTNEAKFATKMADSWEELRLFEMGDE